MSPTLFHKNELTILILILLLAVFSLFCQFKSKIYFFHLHQSLKVVNSDFPNDNEDNHQLVAVVMDVVVVVIVVSLVVV